MKTLMKQISIFLLLTFVLISCNQNQTVDLDNEKNNFSLDSKILYYKGSSFSGIVIEHYENRQVKVKKSYSKGKLDGDWEKFHDNGQLKEKGSYNEGEMVGVWEWYYNGKLDYKGSYKEGKKEGVWEEYRENGQLKVKSSYKEGEKEGVWEEYRENGQLSSKGSVSTPFSRQV